MTDTDQVGEADAKALAVYIGLSERVSKLEQQATTFATREWIYQKALWLIFAGATIAASLAAAVVNVIMG